MKTPQERYRSDPYFHTLVDMFRAEFEKCDSNGVGLTPTEIREASALAWQLYSERNFSPIYLGRVDDKR